MLVDVASVVLDAQDNAIILSKNPDLVKVRSWAVRGWPDKLDRSDRLYPYFLRRHEMSTIRGCLLWGNRTIIPSAGQRIILKTLHAGHPGIVRMKALARSYVW